MNENEIPAAQLDAEQFITHQVKAIAEAVPEGTAINALSGGVDSSVVTLLGHRALGARLLTYFIDNGLMRQGEAEEIVATFRRLGVPVTVVEAQEQFLAALRGLEDPEAKREAIARTFYRDVFGELVRSSGARTLLQGTILTDVEETVAGIKRQHNVFEQLGIDPQSSFGYRILEPLRSLRKDGVRKVAQALGLPESTYRRMPFPGPALAARVIGEVTAERIALVRAATAIVEAELAPFQPFQVMAILHADRVTGMRDGRRAFGHQIEVRSWESVDARWAAPSRLPFETLERIAERLTNEVPGVVSVTYNVTRKPPSTMEAV